MSGGSSYIKMVGFDAWILGGRGTIGVPNCIELVFMSSCLATLALIEPIVGPIRCEMLGIHLQLD